MKIAAVLMNCVFADVKVNVRKCEELVRKAAEQKAKLVLLPEFFSSAIGFSPKMTEVALQGGYVFSKMKKLADKYQIIIGGSYLSFNGNDSYNKFSLVFPDGMEFTHCKDIPTQFENCYYTNGDTENVLHTPVGDIGIALCWEMLRTDTAKRLNGKADIILAGSCWWDIPMDAPKERDELRQYNRNLSDTTPQVFSRALNIPLVHSCHCGTVSAFNFPTADKLQNRQLVGAAQMISGDGNLIAHRAFNEGEGIIVADVPFGKRKKKNLDEYGYWIPKMRPEYISAWENINPVAAKYYREVMRNHYLNNFDSATGL